MKTSKTDLTAKAPRSPRVRLGGYVILPRMLDKGRATLAGKNGEYHFDCPMDKRFLSFVGIDANKLKDQLAAGKGDGEILEWINANATNKFEEWQIQDWSAHQENRVPADTDSRSFFQKLHTAAGPKREDVTTWFELLDLDDFVSFGGKA